MSTRTALDDLDFSELPDPRPLSEQLRHAARVLVENLTGEDLEPDATEPEWCDWYALLDRIDEVAIRLGEPR